MSAEVEHVADDQFTPPGWRAITPRIVARDARGLVDFVRQVFGASGEFSNEHPTVLSIGDSMLMISEAGEREAMPAFLYVYVTDVDATWQRAVVAGASTLEEPAEMPYGDRRAMLRDRWRNTWQIARWRG
jgi:uncharacterized glyoxalase superfamily protein PhnB